jgi:hypothetical protein
MTLLQYHHVSVGRASYSQWTDFVTIPHRLSGRHSKGLNLSKWMVVEMQAGVGTAL